MCLNACGMDVHLEDGRIVEVRGMRERPFRKLCFEPRGLAGWVYSVKISIPRCSASSMDGVKPMPMC